MKQLLFLLLFPAYAMAQYQGNANQKITLGEQTTADGLVWRGIRADTTSKIVPFSDTSAYIILDTVEKTLWLYKAGQVPKWQQVGGSTLDTATMLLPYYRAGRNTIIQAADVPTLNQNTTGSAATLTTGRTIQTNLASTLAATFNGSANITPGVTGTLPITNGGTGQTTLAAAGIITGSGTANYLPKYTAATTLGNSLIYDNGSSVGIGTTTVTAGFQLQLTGTNSRFAMINSSGNTSNFSQMLFGNGGGTGQYAEFYRQNNTKRFHIYNDGGDLAFSTRYNSGYIYDIYLNTSGNVGIGTTSPQSGYKLHVVDSVYVGGNVSASAYTTRSDYDLKDEIQNINYGINEVMQMHPVKYTYKSNGSTQLGFIAQDLGVITPEVVSFEDKMSVYYNALIPILTKAIQEQQALINALEQRIINLENK